ncbi:MAG: TolC family protein [Bacteroidales bacterium]|nr:TolC family protein [Bacteroidales bacterium]
MFSLLLLNATAIVAPQTAPQAQEQAPATLTLEEAIRIALSESPTVKIAEMEVEKAQFAKKGSYAALFPQISASASYQRTIKKQIMYMGGGDDDDDEGGGGMSDMMSGIVNPIMYHLQQLYKGTGVPYVEYTPDPSTQTSSSDGGIEVGRWNTYNAGITAAMPLINAQLWKSLEISGSGVDLAVEKARSSRLEMVNQVKQSYFGVLLAKEAHQVYKSVYDNAVQNLDLTQKKYNASRASELDLARAKTTVANAVPNLFNAENAIYLSLWQLKAVMGIDLDAEIDVKDSLLVYSADLQAANFNQDYSIEGNSSLRQLAIQADQLANTVKMQKYAYLPTLSLAFSYSLNAMTNDFKFEEYKWTPYSYVGLSLNIPIFSGGQRLNDLRQTQVQSRQLALQKENAERQLQISIRQSLSTMETAVKSHESALDALESAQKAYDIAAKSYEVGRSTLTDLDAAQLALTQAQLSASQAIYNYLVAKAALESTIGADYTIEK